MSISSTYFRQVFPFAKWHVDPLERRVDVPVKLNVVVLSVRVYRCNFYSISSHRISSCAGSIAVEVTHTKPIGVATQSAERPKLNDLCRIFRSCPTDVGVQENVR